jgi:hypothetical protein
MAAVKRVCLGFAVAGVLTGAGAAVSTAVAQADSDTSSSAGSSSSAAKATKPTTSDTAAKGQSAARSPGSAASAKTVTTKTIRPGPRRTTGAPTLKSVSTATSSSVTKVTFDVAPASAGDLAGYTVTSSRSRSAAIAAAVTDAVTVDPTNQHVLVIGVDGTNLSRILENPSNTNFFAVMDDGTTAAASIVGHTTISNPSWTAILTGVWDTKSGVINNVFTPETYDTWPTVFNQLEGANRAIYTKAIADWDVITDIAGAGSIPADEVVYVPQVDGDTDWAKTDAAVTAETITSLQGEEAPNFLFSYLVQVDENGHLYGGASQQYADAISRTDDNLGAIMDAVHARERATGEEWTVIIVTDHGHQPQQGFGHGFQSPAETSTFVIADGPDFDSGKINTKYQIVDITPTVVSLFGIAPTVDADGVPLTSLGGSQLTPVDLHQALNDIIDMNGYPSLPVDAALTVRTIFGTIPYFVYTFTNSITAQLQDIVDQDIPVVSQLAGVTKIGAQLLGDAVYAVTNAVAQIVGKLTGAGVIPPSTSTSQLAPSRAIPVLV